MFSNALLPALLILTGATTLVPILEDFSARQILYWSVMPPLLAGIIVILVRLGGA